jgi:hypothetical protein
MAGSTMTAAAASTSTFNLRIGLLQKGHVMRPDQHTAPLRRADAAIVKNV